METIRQSVEASREALRPAIGQRHFVTGLRASTSSHAAEDLYWRLVAAESKLAALDEDVKRIIDDMACVG